MDLTQQVKARARQLGADLVGIAPVERFAAAPLRMSPQGLLPGARYVVVAGIHHLDAAVELSGRPTPHDIGSYRTQSTAQNPKLDDISFLLARLLEVRGQRALPIAASNMWRYRAYKDVEVSFAPDLAHRYAAVAAGLGQIGWSGLVLTPQFGPRVRFVSVVTDAALAPSAMYDGPDLCDQCMRCVETCPTDAFRKEAPRINELEIGGKTFRFPETNKWRCAWAENFCLDLAHEIPETVDEPAVLRYLERHGQRGGELGCCLQFCMSPQQRHYDKSYCRPPRRKKEITQLDGERLLQAVEEILDKAGVDVAAVGATGDFDGCERVRPQSHLPDVASVISIGVRVPPKSEDNTDYLGVVTRRLNYAAFEVAHHLDLAGYSAICNTGAQDEPAAQMLGVHEPHAQFATVLTSAALPPGKPSRPRRPAPTAPEGIRALCREAGADLVGFLAVGRFAEFRAALRNADLPPRQAQVVEDAGLAYGPYVPRIRAQKTEIKTPADWLAGARSVIVLGLHFPDTAVDTAKVTPAETVGPFAFVRYEAQRLAGDAAFRLVKALNDAGWRATLTYDLAGQASRVASSRGLLPDLRANRFAAALSGLATIGLHGCPLTAEFGPRQVFAAVVTDLALPDDPLNGTAHPCEHCRRPCAQVCPTAAIEEEWISLELDGVALKLPRVDAFACDWAKRYCLAGQEGPKYRGLTVDVPLPAERTARAVAEAVSRIPWGVQKRLLDVAEECVRVCPAGRE